MWSSIKNIIKPESLKEAVSVRENEHSVYFAGGSYLVSEKDPNINTLIDINHLLPVEINIETSHSIIGAGATLQQVIDRFTGAEYCRFADSARSSCVSKNIRNQRTIGGEIVKERTDSEVVVFMYAVNAVLSVFNDSSQKVSIQDWDGSGIITEVEISNDRIRKSAFERFSLLPSAPAFVIVDGSLALGELTISVGGKADQVSVLAMEYSDWNDIVIEDFSKVISQHFLTDQYGSKEYKKNIIEVGINRVLSKLKSE